MSLTLFGGTEGWKAEEWTASDDQVRGGSSQSYLNVSGETARFHGTLDTKTLGGAGFASQRTTGASKSWDLSNYDGIYIEVEKADEKRYTLALKDEILPPNPADGREQSTISYEFDFDHTGNQNLFISWDSLKPTYRGKERNDAPALNTKDVKRFSIMNRSFFGSQEGDFSITIKSIKAVLRTGDLEAGIIGERGGRFKSSTQEEPWSWKSSRAIGLGFILSTTWAICFSFCWIKGYDISHMKPLNWWRMVRG